MFCCSDLFYESEGFLLPHGSTQKLNFSDVCPDFKLAGHFSKLPNLINLFFNQDLSYFTVMKFKCDASKMLTSKNMKDLSAKNVFFLLPSLS